MANLTQFHPLEDLLRDFAKGFWIRPMLPATTPELQMKIDVEESDEAFKIKADIPGVRKEDIQVDIEEDRISLRAEARQENDEKKGEKVVYSERSYGMVGRSFTLPTAVDAKAAWAEYKDGVLRLTLPKKQGDLVKRIAVA